MEPQQVGERCAKPQPINPGGSGDVDNAAAYTDNSMNAETDDGLSTGNPSDSSPLDPAAQSAYLSLLAAKSPKSSVYKTYDRTRRSRTFIPHWVVEYPWLEFNAERECMFCIYCREYQSTHDREFTNTFVHGATNFRLDSVKAHANSTKHRQVMMVMSGKIALAIPKPASKQGGAARSSLKIGALFENDADGLNNSVQTAINRSEEDEGIPRHFPTDITDESCAANQMSSYIKTLQNIYPHLPLSDLTSPEPSLPTVNSQTPTQIQMPPPSARTDAFQEPMRMEEDELDNVVKEEPTSPCLEEQQTSGHDETELDEGDVPSMSSGGRRVARKAPSMIKMWQVNRSCSMSQGAMSQGEEEDGVDEDYGQADQGYDGFDAEDHLQNSGQANTYYFNNPTVPVYRQGKLRSRLLPKAKRQKLEKILSRQMQGEDMSTNDDSQGNHQNQSELEADSSSSKDSHWKHLAESFMEKYNLMCEEHNKMKKLYQTKVASLEKRYSELEEATRTRQRESPTSSSPKDGGSVGQGGCSPSSPRINMYSSVVILQVKGQDPVSISSNTDANFDSVQQSLSRSGIHISLGANTFPSGVDQENFAAMSPGGQRSHSNSSTTASPEKTANSVEQTGSCDKAGGKNVSPGRARTTPHNGRITGQNVMSGVGSDHQNSFETREPVACGQHNETSGNNGYLMGTGMLPEGDVDGNAAPVGQNDEQPADVKVIVQDS